ncbi:MAG TPA: flagellar biosynthetic protein FliO [Pirellulales bacterium]|nr:flagellar biosynthetic protein FliO [Pirellulales bacterium]
MAQRIGPRITLAVTLITGVFAIAALADDGGSSARLHRGSSSPANESATMASPRYPEGFGPKDEHVDQAAYQRPLDGRADGDSQKSSAIRSQTSGLRSSTSDVPPLGGPTPAATDSAGHGTRREVPAMPGTGPALLSMFGSLAIVLALFFGLVWLLRRGMPKGTRLVPSEVVEVLGRAALAGRQQMHVVRFGSKVLLISVTPGGAETLSEITEPAEVDRLSGICQQSHAQSATNAFRQVFRQFAEDRSPFRRRADRKTVSEAITRSSNSTEDDDV